MTPDQFEQPITGRILAVDPGDVRIGIAISDPTATIANPLTVLKHIGRMIDAAAVAQLAAEHGAIRIVVGQPFDSEGHVGPAGRKSARLAEAIRAQTNLPVELWDESGSTQEARAARIEMGTTRRKRQGHMDEMAAVYILQTYLDALSTRGAANLS